MDWTEDQMERLPGKDDLRIRGLEMTRPETFCDAAFAFAVTLLVISGGDIPSTYGALLGALQEVPAFLVSFALIWVAHRRRSRRYGLEDGATTVISLAMVFVMLVYVYPLRMVASAFMAFTSGGALPSSFMLAAHSDLTGLFVVYGVGFAAQTALLALLYGRAPAAGERLRLNAIERVRTRQEIALHSVLSLTGLASALVAAVLPTVVGVWAGFVYMTLPVTMSVVATRYARAADRIRG